MSTAIPRLLSAILLFIAAAVPLRTCLVGNRKVLKTEK